MIYHKQLGFPKTFRRPVGRFALTMTKHILDQSTERGITVPSHVDFNRVDVIEVGFAGGRMDHLLIRFEYNDHKDICIPLAVKYGKMVAKTVWLCDTDDDHSTLNPANYATP